MTIGGLQVRNSKDALTIDSRLSVLCHAQPKFGKTRFGGTLDAVTRKYLGKPTLYVMTDAGEGGGSVSIADLGVDIITPETVADYERIMADLEQDTYYGGVVLDSFGEFVKRILTPYVTSSTSTNETNRATLDARKEGVPTRTDYAKIGERGRMLLNRLVGLSTVTKVADGVRSPDPDRRKHIVIMTQSRIKTDDNNKVISIGPDLPGQLADNACGLVQTVLSLRRNPIRTKDSEGKPSITYEYSIMSQPDAPFPYVVGDRFEIFKNFAEPNFLDIYETHFLPKIEGNT